MSHNSKIRDTETHFIIDPPTRKITNASAGNNTIVQYDHNSERFTFEIPRYVDGHDMLEVSEVRVHYRNSSSANLSTTNGVYIPDDLSIFEDDENVLTFSWLLSAATTQYIGYLYFSIQFVCLNGDTVEYAWNTGVYKDITVIESINNTDETSIEVVDAIESIKNELEKEIQADISDLRAEADAAISHCEDVASDLRLAKDNGEFDGKDGYTPQKNVDYFDGKDGYTPQKNVDYFDGKDGNGITSAVLNDDYTLTLDFDDGTSYATPSIRGASGVGIKGVTISEVGG